MVTKQVGPQVFLSPVGEGTPFFSTPDQATQYATNQYGRVAMYGTVMPRVLTGSGYALYGINQSGTVRVADKRVLANLAAAARRGGCRLYLQQPRYLQLQHGAVLLGRGAGNYAADG